MTQPPGAAGRPAALDGCESNRRPVERVDWSCSRRTYLLVHRRAAAFSDISGLGSKAVASVRLIHAGINVSAIMPPAVAAGEERLRFFVSSELTICHHWVRGRALVDIQLPSTRTGMILVRRSGSPVGTHHVRY